MARVIDNLILENYDAFVTENEETLFSDPAEALKWLLMMYFMNLMLKNYFLV